MRPTFNGKIEIVCPDGARYPMTLGPMLDRIEELETVCKVQTYVIAVSTVALAVHVLAPWAQ